MSSLSTLDPAIESTVAQGPVDHPWRRLLKSGRIVIGGSIMLACIFASLLTLPITMSANSNWHYDAQHSNASRQSPTLSPAWKIFGTDSLGRSMLSRCLIGGAISLAIGVCAAVISVFLGVTIGLVAGYRGGLLDSLLMRLVDILYGLPYILLVILLKIACEQPLTRLVRNLTNSSAADQIANFIVLFIAIGAVSWLTMARVVRGQVLSLRSQPFIEACKAGGLTEWRIFTHHLLPNLIGPITVYTTLIIPGAILNESFLSFLGIGIKPPMPTWGSLASDGLLPALNPINHRWWLLVFPCLLLAITLLSLNFVGDGLRDVFDPKRDAAKI